MPLRLQAGHGVHARSRYAFGAIRGVEWVAADLLHSDVSHRCTVAAAQEHLAWHPTRSILPETR